MIVCMHRLRNVKTGLTDTLSKNNRVPVSEPFDKEPILKGCVYVAPANYHLLVEPAGYFTLSTFKRINHSRPSIDVTMKSAATVCREQCTGVLLSGANTDGVDGLIGIQKMGGTTVVQDPLDAEIPAMPESAIQSFAPDYILTAEKITTFIQNMCGIS
jgi:two-component system chemotaxis response regulator CheB